MYPGCVEVRATAMRWFFLSLFALIIVTIELSLAVTAIISAFK